MRMAAPSDPLWLEVARFDPTIPIERAWMPPSSWYTEPAFDRLERDAVLQPSWQPACRVTEVSDPGQYVSGCCNGLPFVVVRDQAGELRAFHNVCSHKGREVVTDRGQSDILICSYHAWKYRLDGSLKSAPRIAGIEEFDRDAMALRPLAVTTWGPWVFINRDLEATPIATRVAPLDDALRAGGWEQLRFAARKEWIIGCNWKVYVDNYLDGGYRIPHMHPTLDAQLDMKSYRTEVFDTFSVQTSHAATEDQAALAISATDRIGTGAIYAWMFPNFMINRYGPCMDSNLVVPEGPDQCRVIYEFYFDESVADAMQFVDDSIAQADLTQAEDIEICESVQVGLHSPAYDRGRYAPRVEIGEHHFHCLLAGAFAEARPGEVP